MIIENSIEEVNVMTRGKGSSLYKSRSQNSQVPYFTLGNEFVNEA